ncbi:hypothetical protein G6045_40310 [Streptomyces sp. YC504]|uniref:Uncharacterized protein n=1 Tax=Streptomyces mesophilus TaxID=1775132 RepID=A0A6G4XW87_9ACTN|nr:hypothetical protein [Streptomyces mesophilus]NGO81845.1 hypothetical protein [Streptomyces mesophilus]
MHILDDPCLSPRVAALLARAQRGLEMPADRIRALARAETSGGDEAAVPPGAVESMIRFEERYGGLWYPLLGPNGMEHGLHGEATIYLTGDGWTFPGILDGDQTWRVDVLSDGSTTMTLARRSRIINSSILQRLEAHAQLSQVRDWPHVTFAVATEPGQEPTVAEAALPPLDAEATGPADRWWVAGGTAIQLKLHKWWGEEDMWVARCFTERPENLTTTVDALRHAVTGGVWRNEDWCGLCRHVRQPAQPCLPHTGKQSS